ncbi:MAG TPA: trypsin-like peptidase domain-containing protein [Bacillota bacterium]
MSGYGTYDHGETRTDTGWQYRPPRRGFGSFGSALVGAVVGGLIVLLLMTSLASYLPAGLLPENFGSAAGPGGSGFDLSARSDSGVAGAQTASPSGSPVVDVVKKVGPSVVAIVNYRQVTDVWSGRSAIVEAAYGSGVIIDTRGHIVTNYHVIEDAAKLEVVVGDDHRRIPARVVAHDYPYSDLAVLKIDPQGLELRPAEFGDSDTVQVGETVVAIGNPKGLDFFRSATVGVISGIRPDLLQKLEQESGYPSNSRIFKLLQTDAAINGGNSGGPLVNLRGEVIGINTLKFSGPATEGMGFALPSNEVRAIVSDLIEHGRVIRPALGVGVIPEDIARMRYGVEQGLLVEVDPSGPAARAGLRSGDVILAINGQPTDDFLTLLKAIASHEVGDVVTLKVRRGEQTLEIDVRLGELTPAGQR